MAVDIFLKLDGVEGESQDDSHKGEIDVLSWSWGMTQSGTFQMGSGGGAGKVNVQDISFSKYVDKSSAAIMQHCASGKHIDKGTLTVRKAGGEAPVDYFKMEFEKIIISSYQTGGSSDGLDRIMENIALNIAIFKNTYTQQTEKGGAGATSTAGWDVPQNKKVG